MSIAPPAPPARTGDDDQAIRLSAAAERYILHWGEMGTRWGVNRSIAQIHALLYLHPRPLNAEQIAATLDIARSNVSTSLRDLQAWGLVQLVHVRGDRRDHFTSETDNWQLLLTIVEGRKRREIDPTLTTLRDCARLAEEDPETDPEVRARIASMASFIETLSNWYDQMRRLPKPTLVALMKMGSGVVGLLPQGRARPAEALPRAEPDPDDEETP